MTVSAANPLGIESFDHSTDSRKTLALRHEAITAMRAWAHSIGDAATYEEWLKMLHQVAASIGFGDGTHDCEGTKAASEWVIFYPDRVEVDESRGWANCRYRCHMCGRVWRCGYALDWPVSLSGLG